MEWVDEGDCIKVTNTSGKSDSGFVIRNEKGNLSFNDEEINTTSFRKKYKVTKCTEEQTSELKDQAIRDYDEDLTGGSCPVCGAGRGKSCSLAFPEKNCFFYWWLAS